MKKRTLYIASIITIIVGMINYFTFYIKKSDNTSEYIAITTIATHINGMDFIDSATYVECHAQIVEDHYKTAHFNSLQPANETTIKGSFDKNKNTLNLNDKVIFNFTKKDSGFYQEPVFNNQNTPFLLHQNGYCGRLRNQRTIIFNVE